MKGGAISGLKNFDLLSQHLLIYYYVQGMAETGRQWHICSQVAFTLEGLVFVGSWVLLKSNPRWCPSIAMGKTKILR